MTLSSGDPPIFSVDAQIGNGSNPIIFNVYPTGPGPIVSILTMLYISMSPMLTSFVMVPDTQDQYFSPCV